MAIDDTAKLFGLTKEQLDVLFSLEYALTLHDIESDLKHSDLKKQWLTEWFDILQKTQEICLVPEDSIKSTILEVKDNSLSHTWLYMVILETTLFHPYYPLGGEQDKLYRKLKFTKQNEYIKGLCRETGIVPEEYVERFQKTYSNAYKKISGNTAKVVAAIMSVVAAAAIAAATAGIAAGPIAIALFGANFAGLHGAALVAACLAMAGGGAIAVGGAGMAGGVAAIVGGGAILGAAAGGAAVAAGHMIAKNMPSFTLSQAAKMEVVMKEILLNAQQDTQAAQLVLEKLKERIHDLQRELDDLKLEQSNNRDQISNLKKSLAYLKKAYLEMNKFKSCYDTGTAAAQNEAI